MNIKTSISIFAAALLLSACGSSSSSSDDSSTTSTSGVAIDGYVKGATVSVNDKNLTTTGDNGIWTVSPAIAAGSIIEISGGTDESTGAAFEGVLKAPYRSGNIVATPLTTVIASMMDTNTTLAAADAATATLAASLGVTSEELLSDPIAVLENNASNAAAATIINKSLQVQKLVETIASYASTDATQQNNAFELIMNSVAKSIKTSGFDAGIADTATILAGIDNTTGLETLLNTAEIKTQADATNTATSSIDTDSFASTDDNKTISEKLEEISKALETDTAANEGDSNTSSITIPVEGATCDDNNSLTENDVYSGWVCQGTTIVVPTPDDNTTTDTNTSELTNIQTLIGDMNATAKYDQFNVATTTGLTATISDFNASQDKVNFIGKEDGDVAVDTNGSYDGTLILTVQSDLATDVAITINGLTADEEFAVQNGTLDILGDLNITTTPSTDTNTSTGTDTNTSTGTDTNTTTGTDTNTTTVADLNVTVTADTTATVANEAFTVATTTGLTATISDFNASVDTLTFTGKVDGDVAVDTNGAYDGTVILTVQSDEATDVAITLNGLTADEEFAVQNGTLDIIK